MIGIYLITMHSDPPQVKLARTCTGWKQSWMLSHTAQEPYTVFAVNADDLTPMDNDADSIRIGTIDKGETLADALAKIDLQDLSALPLSAGKKTAIQNRCSSLQIKTDDFATVKAGTAIRRVLNKVCPDWHDRMWKA